MLQERLPDDDRNRSIRGSRRHLTDRIAARRRRCSTRSTPLVGLLLRDRGASARRDPHRTSVDAAVLQRAQRFAPVLPRSCSWSPSRTAFNVTASCATRGATRSLAERGGARRGAAPAELRQQAAPAARDASIREADRASPRPRRARPTSSIDRRTLSWTELFNQLRDDAA